ncbi:MAG: hypothetical protein K9G39_03045 [Chlorobium sp.]|uniref:hypothetical protein n=1 Tax=Chlorobium sp. TaxID=1095 RepID=UPI0025BEB5CC|nr:hypothetical protein [Chlorobium sp.]MCF8382561.1 hypothetical protein [Chlorobium sp.]
MKRPDEHIEAEIRRTLDLLDDLPVLHASPLFRVHLMQRIEASQSKGFGYGAFRQAEGFRIKFAVAALLLVVNISSALLFFSSPEPLSMADAGETIEQLSDDYSGEVLAYYVETDDTSSNRQNGKQAAKENIKP